MDDSSRHRWAEMLDGLAGLLPAGSRRVLVDGPADRVSLFAARLSERLAARGRPVLVTADAGAARDVAVFLRTAPGGRRPAAPAPGRPGAQAAERDEGGRREREARADVVIDLHDIGWPVIRRVAAPLAAGGSWYLTETRAFFACRAATWDAKFGDDIPAYRAAVDEAGIRPGGVVIDVGCGTGRALAPLRDAVGPAGTVIAFDVTPEMLDAARPASAAAGAVVVLADARALPLRDGCADAIFAAGLVNHLPDTEAGLRELARVIRTGGKLVLFHPSGRVTLAARHGNAVSPDEPLAEGPLRRSTRASGWLLTAYDDAPHRFFALAERRLPAVSRRGRFGQCGDARGEQAPHLVLLAGLQVGQHALLDAADRGAGHVQLAAPAGGQLGRQCPADGCLRRADDESLAFEGLQEHVHRLPGDEGAAGELGVRQARPLGEQLQAGIVGDRHAERPQHGLQG
jgi:SAM-dependent methyltransferase